MGLIVKERGVVPMDLNIPIRYYAVNTKMELFFVGVKKLAMDWRYDRVAVGEQAIKNPPKRVRCLYCVQLNCDLS